MKSDQSQRFGPQEGRRITNNIQRGDQAFIERGQQLGPSTIRKMVIDLSTAPANPMKIGFPFKSVYISSASDTSAEISLRPYSDSDNNDWIPLALKDSWKIDYPINAAFLTWTAQAGKSVTVIFFTDSSFDSGSNISQTSGALDGNSINDFAPVTLSSTNAAVIDNTSRNVINVINEGPDLAYIGSSGVSAVGGSEVGIPLAVGQERVFNNSAVLYGASVGSSKIRYQTES